MKRWITSIIAVAVLLGFGVTIFPAVAEDDKKLSVPVAFGRGLNTAQPGNSVNHVNLAAPARTRETFARLKFPEIRTFSFVLIVDNADDSANTARGFYTCSRMGEAVLRCALGATPT